MLSRLLRTYLRRYKTELGLLVLFQIFQALATLYLPSITADIIDHGIFAASGPDRSYILHRGAFMLGVTVLQVVANSVAIYFGAKIAMAFGRDVRDGVFQQVSSYSAREVGQFGAPSLITRTTNDVQQVQMFTIMAFTLFVAAPIMCIGGIVMALREDVGLSWSLTVAVPALVIGVGLIVWRMIPQFRIMQEKVDGVNRVLREQITGIRVVRAFVREPAERRRFEKVNGELTDTGLRAGHLQALLFPVVTTVLNGSSIAVLWIGAGRVGDHTLQIGALIAFLTYLTQILMAVMMATFIAILAPRAAVCAERINEVLDTDSTIVTSPTAQRELPRLGRVELRDVGFGYPGAAEPVLTGISLTAQRGQTTAIIGSTGSGKTTLLSLIPRLFDATGGAVLVDGVDVRDVEPEVLWSRMGLVPQRPFLFSGTVATNLRFSKPDASDNELWDALRIAQGADFVAAMPGGLDAPISQGGTNVSGGQRQRLAIARALVRKPSILLFDDSFSALDLATDARLRAALAPHTADATVFIVAQRVSTIMTADQILVLEDGHTVGLGHHDDLLGTCPTYREIVDSQLRGEEAA
jgi:ATP-binding cassette subfamily B protein